MSEAKGARPRFGRGRATLAAALMAAALMAAALGGGPAEAEGAPPGQALLDGALGLSFVEEAVCADCHAAEAEAWRGSHHAKAMAPAAPGTVLGDFDNARYASDSLSARFFSEEERLFIEVEEPGADASRRLEVVYAFGVHPLQQYLVKGEGGRLHAFTVAWDVEAERWYDVAGAVAPERGDPRHWEGRFNVWNTRCAECHSTDLRKGYDPATDSFATTYAAVNVGCQACHGPGEAHVAWAQEAAEPPMPGLDRVGLVRTPQSELGPAETCARCHSRRSRLVEEDVHGAPFSDQFILQSLDEGFYHADGQVDDEVFVLGSFLQSRMRRAGVVCGDCHEPHTSELRAEGDAMCLACHNESPDQQRFAGLQAKIYDAPSHHGHPPESAGARCASCHMPVKNFMVVDARRDHSFRIPRPDLAAATGAPDACTSCHQDRDPAWAAAAIDGWRGTDWRRPHAGETIAAARRGAPRALRPLAALSGDQSESGVMRATAVDLLGRYGPASREAQLAALDDPDPLVRAKAAESLLAAAPPDRLAALEPLLDDSSRLVRLSAARTMASAVRQAGAVEGRATVALEDLDPRLSAGLEAYIAAQRGSAESPEAQINLAALSIDLGDHPGAVAAFERALALAPDFGPGYYRYATYLSGRGESGRAEAVLRQGVSNSPGFADGHFALGLLLAENGDLRSAEVSLRRALEIAPEHVQARYNHALALMRLDRLPAAVTTLSRGLAAAPDTPQLTYLLAFAHMRSGQLDLAESVAEDLAAAQPGWREAVVLLEQIRAMLAQRQR